MLNGSALNRAGLNGPASVPLIQGTGTWTASGVLDASAYQIHGAVANIAAGVNVTFTGDKLIPAIWAVSAESDSVMDANMLHGANGSWNGTVDWQAYIIRVIEGEAGFDVSSVFEVVPGAVFSNLDWAGGADAAFEAALSGALTGQWVVAAELAGDSLISRGVSSDWQGDAVLWSEPTITSGGVVYHEGYLFLEGGAVWENIPYLTATFTTGAFQSGGADWVGNAHAIYAGRGQWVGNLSWTIPATLISRGAAAFSMSSAFSVVATYSGRAQITWTGSSSLISRARMNHAGKVPLVGSEVFTAIPSLNGGLRGSFVIQSSVSFTGVRGLLPVADISGNAALSAIGLVTQSGEANWSGLGSTLIAGATKTASLAPPERRLKIPAMQRRFFINPETRKFKVAA